MSEFALVLQHVSVTRGDCTLLSDINMAVPPGCCHAVLGPNGAGKSALVSVCAGFMWPTTGVVQINGKTLGKTHLSPLRRDIGLIEPSRCPDFPAWMTTYEVVATGLYGSIMLPLGVELSAEACQIVENEIETFRLGPLREALFSRLSTGEKMKSLLARALVGQPRLLLLDEPTTGLDLGARAACVTAMETLLERSEAPAVLVVSHHVEELPRTVDRVVLLKAGRVFKQGVGSAMLTDEYLSVLFDCEVRVRQHEGRYTAQAVSARW